MDSRIAKRLTPSEFRGVYQKYQITWRGLMKHVDEYHDVALPYRSPWWTRYYWVPFILAARDLANAILSSKEIPRKDVKKLEMAARLVNTARRPPKDVVQWYKKNEPRFTFLEAASSWPEKKEDTDQLFRVGPFLVHNTVALSGPELEAVKKSIEKAVDGIKSLQVPDMQRVLYGDIHIVARLQQSRTIAWYLPSTDQVYVRPFKNVGYGEVQSLIHELGHRYLHKFVNGGSLLEWSKHHNAIGSSAKVEMPRPGDPIPVPVKGRTTPPTVSAVVPGVRLELAEGGYIPWDALYKILKKDQAASQYPTRYAATNYEEHFCEAMSLRALGKLQGAHLEAFQRIFEGKKTMPEISVQRVAARYAASTYVQISREELEDWLRTLNLYAKPYLLPGKAGVYMLPVSDSVAIKLSSTIGTRDDAMGRGQASMQLSLVSRVVSNSYGPVVLNKKAQGQSHFARTLNWRKNWKVGVDRMKDAYVKAASFYDALALIEDREKYKRDLLARIESIPNWRNHNVVSDFHARVTRGGILTTAQVELLSKVERSAPKESSDDDLLRKMRLLYVEARKRNDNWLLDFLTSLGQWVKRGRSPSPKQQAILDKNFARYRII